MPLSSQFISNGVLFPVCIERILLSKFVFSIGSCVLTTSSEDLQLAPHLVEQSEMTFI
jgi:hypothetical protein